MKIGIVTTWFERGAAIVSRAYRDVLSSDHEVFIYARGGEAQGKGDPRWDTSDVTWGARNPRWPGRLVWDDFKQWAEAKEIDVILWNEQQDFAPIVFARRELDVAQGAYIDYYTARTVPFFGLYDFVICNTRRHHSVFADHRRAVHIPWGTDCSLYTGDGSPVAEDTVVFFHSAGMSPERKGTLTAVKAFAMVEGDARFVLHTQRPVAESAGLAEACAADSRVEVIEETVAAPGLYHRGDVYVYPTTLEGVGLSVPEALACGLPVVAPDCPPMNEFVHHGENGRLVKPSEYRGRADGYYWSECHCASEDVAAEMRYYLAERKHLTELKHAARASAVERMDWAKNAADLPAMFDELSAERARRPDDAALEEAALALADLSLPRHAARFALRRLGLLNTRFAQHLIYG